MRSPWISTSLLGALVASSWLAACLDSPCTLCPPAPSSYGLIASDPVLSTPAASGSALARSLSAGDSTVYVTLFPGTAPEGRLATVRVVGNVDTVMTSVVDGGFDPIPIFAGVGDSIEAVVKDAGGAVVKRLGLAVAALRPPVIVRTEPPPRKRDQPLNAALVVVFSEPVSGSSLTPSSVQLFRGSTQVTGSVSLLQGTGSAAAFTSNAALSPNTDYRLVVTQAVRDRQGDALAASVTVPFTTGQSSTGVPASITVSPDSVFLTGATYQMTATVRDAAGNQLIDQPVTWSTSDPSGLTVSPNGLVTALAAGYFEVTATTNSVIGRASVVVIPGPAASIAMMPTQATVGAAGDTISVVATVRDALGRLLNHPVVTWTSSDVAVASVAADSAGNAGLAFATVTGVSPGSVTITATSGTASNTASVTVIPPLPVASVMVSPASVTLVVQGTRQLSATVRDANGKVLAGRPISWTTDNATVATVDTNGLVTAVGQGSAGVAATSEGVSDTAALTVTAVTFGSVSAGDRHSCGLTTATAAYCWGDNGYGQLGDGSIVNSTVPVAVAGGLSFAAVSVGESHTCAVTTGGAAYCWGRNDNGQLGDGSNVSSTVPVAVAGGLRFAAISAGDHHTCGVTTGGAAYCWGSNGGGALGDGTTTDRAAPVAVLGGLSFVKVSVGGVQQLGHTCGVTTGGAAYCWGYNQYGQLGDGTTTERMSPVAVLGGLSFVEVRAADAPGGATCGVTTSDAAYCWGFNGYGQLGDGTTTDRTSPVAVLGGLGFTGVTVGGYTGAGHSCGITTGGAAYCWGYNDWGQLGDGTMTDRTSPVAVLGGLSFAALSAGSNHTCGVTAAGTAYCWGHGGLLGDGKLQNSLVPVKVAGQP